MNFHSPSREDIIRATHTLLDRQLWAEQLLTRIQAVMHARGHARHKELQQLELVVRIEMNTAKDTEPLHHFIRENSGKLRAQLSEKHAQLSESDLFLCACIQCGLSISDVARIKGVSPATINMNRYRLKKKIGLPRHEELEHYILNF